MAAKGASPMSMATDFWHFYLQMLQEHPFKTKIATGVTGAFLGDLLAQALPSMLARFQSHKQQNPVKEQPWRYDFIRASRLMLFSALLGTPVAHFWYQALDSMISPGNPTAISTVATKVALDQLLLTPVMTSLFFAVMCCMEGRAHAALQSVRTKLVPTLKLNYLLWPAAHCINFAFIPSDQRILYINCVAILWTVVLSTAANSPAEPQDAVPAAKAMTPVRPDAGGPPITATVPILSQRPNDYPK